MRWACLSCRAALGWGVAGCRTYPWQGEARRRCTIRGPLPGDPNHRQADRQYPRQGRRAELGRGADVAKLGCQDVEAADVDAGRGPSPAGQWPPPPPGLPRTGAGLVSYRPAHSGNLVGIFDNPDNFAILSTPSFSAIACTGKDVSWMTLSGSLKTPKLTHDAS